MRQKLLLLSTLFITLFAFNGCYYEETIIIEDPTPRASVVFDFWSGARTVEVDGEIYNDGNVYIQSVDIEVFMYDEFGYLLSSYIETIYVGLHPRAFFTFQMDFFERHVYDVDVAIRGIRS